jgi:hypothetical protein
MKLISENLSTAKRENDYCRGERLLWAEVMQQAFYRATVGDAIAINFFRSEMFHQLCGMLDLPEQLIQERLLSKIPQRKLQQRNNNTGENHDR